MKNKTKVFDRFTHSTRRVTDEGYLIATGTLARAGIHDYLAKEVGLIDRKPFDIVKVYRPPSEMIKSIPSFDGVPITLDHPPGEMVNAENWKEYSKGEARDAKQDGDTMTATLIVRDKEARDAIEGGKKELSNGYWCNFDATPGVTPEGEAYDVLQTGISGNHVAIVDKGRGGAGCRVNDSGNPAKFKGEKRMAKVSIDGLPLEVEDPAAEIINSVVKQRNEARDEAAKGKAAIAEVAGLKAALDAAKAENETLKKQVIDVSKIDAMVAERAAVVDAAKKLVSSVAIDGKTNEAIQRDVLAELVKDAANKTVIDAVLQGAAITDAAPEIIAAAFRVASATAKATGDKQEASVTDSIADVLAGNAADQGSAKDTQPLMSAADAWAQSRLNAWKG